MATDKMTYHEFYGSLPESLLRLIRKNNVTPAEFQEFEYMGLTFGEMETAILENSPNGYFNHFSWMQDKYNW